MGNPNMNCQMYRYSGKKRKACESGGSKLRVHFRCSWIRKLVIIEETDLAGS